jgi:two-component system NtrC family sensor kinase
MYPKGLKTGLVLNLLLIIAAAMFLVDLVMISSARRGLVQSRIETANILLAMTGQDLLKGLAATGISSRRLLQILNEADANCIQALDRQGQQVFVSGSDCTAIESLGRNAELSLESGTGHSSFHGKTKGVLWAESKSVVVSRPIFADGEISGVVAVELGLEGIYTSLRRSQRIFLIYLPINLLFLAMFGFFRFYRGVIKPINRLVETAEEFRDDEEFSFLSEGRSGEFNRLSHSLNKMVSRINRDRTRLQETIAELETANRELRKAQQEIIRAEKLASVGRLSAGVAHEIGNPIGIVIGYLDLLKQNSLSGEQKDDFIRRAEGEVNRVNIIIRQLLDFARQSSDEDLAEVPVNEVVREVREICAVLPLMSGISIRTEIEASGDLVMGNSDQLKQVLINLLINAADAISSEPLPNKEPLVVIRTANTEEVEEGTVKGRFLQIDCRDNGSGIEAGELENIFDPFYTTKEPGKGTGLGLSICFTIIESMGGVIRATSDGEGTTITVVLPLVGEPSNILQGSDR